MAVDFELFQEWANGYFGESNIKIRNTNHGVEICTNSIWSEQKIGKTDTKFHLWMSPSGGVSKHPEFGSYRCWLTDTMGSLVGLVSHLEGIGWDEAETLICGESSLRSLEMKVHEFFGSVIEEPVPVVEAPKKSIVQLPLASYLIDKMDANHFMAVKARSYLSKRKIPTDGLYICIRGDYKNRIIIPYYNADGELIYYNSRILSDRDDVLRYMKCPTSVVDQKEVLYMTEWARVGSKIYIMEGEFDAITLKLCGLVGCACGGKFLSDTQFDLIKDYEIVLAFDADDAGLEAIINIGNKLLENGVSKISYVRPPKVYKDWNKLYASRDAATVRGYIDRFTKPYTPNTPAILMLNNI